MRCFECSFLTKSVLALVAATFLMEAGAHAQARNHKENLLANPTFEKKMAGWKVHTWTKKGVVILDKDELYEGKPTLRIENSGDDDTMVVQVVNVTPKTRYRLSAKIKTQDVSPQNPRSEGGAVLAIRGGFERSESTQKTRAWRTVTYEFDTGAKTELELGPRLGFYSAMVTGTAWFAEVSLVELGPSRR